MSLLLDEDESFSLTANVESPGYQTVALKGYLVSRRSDGVYIAPLIPQLFYGVNGSQLQTWRQNIPIAGSQVILSRAAGGHPEVPKQELYWRKVSSQEKGVEQEVRVVVAEGQPFPWIPVAVIIGAALLVGAYALRNK